LGGRLLQGGHVGLGKVYLSGPSGIIKSRRPAANRKAFSKESRASLDGFSKSARGRGFFKAENFV